MSLADRAILKENGVAQSNFSEEISPSWQFISKNIRESSRIPFFSKIFLPPGKL
jgi:hypothetical protein